MISDLHTVDQRDAVPVRTEAHSDWPTFANSTVRRSAAAARPPPLGRRRSMAVDLVSSTAVV